MFSGNKGCCVTMQGIARDCDNSIGGIRRAWGACANEVTTPMLDSQGAMISAIPESDPWKLYEFRKETGSVTTTITKDQASGSLYYSSDIVLQFAKQETVKRLEVMAIAQGDTEWIIEDNNGKYWYFGYYWPVNLSDGTAETGTALADLNGYNVTLQEVSKYMPYEISADAMAAILGQG